MAPGSKSDDRLKAKARKLTRNKSNPGTTVEIQPVTCIRGGHRKDWLVLPLKLVNGRQCAGFCPREAWLHQLLNGGCGHGRVNRHVGAVANFFQECVIQFQQSMERPSEGCKPGHAAGSEGAAGCEPSLAGQKGKYAVMSASEDEQTEEEVVSHSRPKKRTRCARRQRRTPRGEFITAKIRGMEFCYTIVAGPRVLIPIDGPWIENMIQDLLSRGDETRKQDSKAVRQDRGPKSLLLEEDKGRISWRARSLTTDAAWLISYTTDRLVTRRTRAGLSVPSAALSGEPITDSAFMEKAKQVLLKARREWNRVDHSGAARYSEWDIGFED